VVLSPQLSDWYWLPGNLVATNALMVDYQPSDVAWMCSSATLVRYLTVPYGVQGLSKARRSRSACSKLRSSRLGAGSATSPEGVACGGIKLRPRQADMWFSPDVMSR
jgi:hypothetical protein